MTQTQPHDSALIAKAAAVGLALVLLAPLLLCVIDRFVWDYAIGPVVLFFSVGATFVMIPAFAWGLALKLGGCGGVLLSLILSPIAGVMVLDYFMFLTALFGVKDYEPM